MVSMGVKAVSYSLLSWMILGLNCFDFTAGDLQACYDCVDSNAVYCRSNFWDYRSLCAQSSDQDVQSFDSVNDYCYSIGSTPLDDSLDCFFDSENGGFVLGFGIIMPFVMVCICLAMSYLYRRNNRRNRSSTDIDTYDDIFDDGDTVGLLHVYPQRRIRPYIIPDKPPMYNPEPSLDENLVQSPNLSDDSTTNATATSNVSSTIEPTL